MSQEGPGISALASLIDAQIAEVAREAADEAESPSVPTQPRESWRPFASYRALVIAWTLCLGLTMVNLEFGGLFTPRFKAPDPFKLVTGLRTSAAMDAVLIESYRSEHGDLPLSLAAVGLPDDDPTLEYQRTEGQSYRVTARHGRFEGIFDSRLETARRASVAEARAAQARRLAAEREERVASSKLRLTAAEKRAEEFRRARGDFDKETIR